MAWFEYHNLGQSEAQEMQALSFLLAQTAPGKAATGVLSGLAVSQTATAGPAVTVSAGAGAVQAATLDGASLVGDVQDNTLDILSGSPVGAVPRNDIVVADRATGSIRAIVGSPNATPTDPTVPTSAIPLARIRQIASGQPNAGTIPTSIIDDLRVFTGLREQPAQPIGSYGRGVGGTIPNGMVWSKLAFTTTLEQSSGMVQSGGDVTVPTDGEYSIEAQVTFPGAAGLSQIGALISVNAATFVYSYSPASTGANWSVRTGRPRRLSAGDKVSLSAGHNATGSLATVSDSVATYLTVRRVGA